MAAGSSDFSDGRIDGDNFPVFLPDVRRIQRAQPGAGGDSAGPGWDSSDGGTDRSLQSDSAENRPLLPLLFAGRRRYGRMFDGSLENALAVPAGNSGLRSVCRQR